MVAKTQTSARVESFNNAVTWMGEHIGRGIMTGLGTILVYAIIAFIIIQSTDLDWLRTAFGIRFSNTSLVEHTPSTTPPR